MIENQAKLNIRFSLIALMSIMPQANIFYLSLLHKRCDVDAAGASVLSIATDDFVEFAVVLTLPQ